MYGMGLSIVIAIGLRHIGMGIIECTSYQLIDVSHRHRAPRVLASVYRMDSRDVSTSRRISISTMGIPLCISSRRISIKPAHRIDVSAY